MENQYQVLLYYKYGELKDPVKVRAEQQALCESLGLKGRIIVAREGINGTVEGLVADTEKYIKTMNKIGEFKDISYKKSQGTGTAFSKLFVRFRPEIITSAAPEIDPKKISGKYITSDELHSWFEQKREFYIVDMRNDYEYLSGFFEGFVPVGIKNFYDLKDALPRLAHLKDKTVVTVCTGGVRCEKASGFLIVNGFKDVYQLKDGIQSYLEKYPNQHFKGKLYVFDSRLTVGFNSDAPEYVIVGRCFHCDKPAESYVNCEYDICHRHYLACRDCLDSETGFAFCNSECKSNYVEVQSKRNKNLRNRFVFS